MKPAALLLAALFHASVLYGQQTAPASPAAGRAVERTAGAPASGAGQKGQPAAVMQGDRLVVRQPAAAKDSHEAAMDPVKLWTLIESGGWVMIPLAVLSVLTGMLVLVYLFTLRRGAILSVHYMNTADVLLKKRDYLGLLAISNRHGEAIARVVQRTLDFATKNPNATLETIREIAETEGQSQASALQHKPVYLADIGMLAPMVGLLGTVVGIIHSFGVLGSTQAGSGSRDLLLAGGVSEALVATAAGLVIGIIAMSFYAVFRNRVQRMISDLEVASAHIVALIGINYNKRREAARTGTDDTF